MARFSSNPRLVQAISEAVAQMHADHARDGRFDTHDVINWMNEHRNAELNDIYDLSRDSDDGAMRADDQIGRFLHSLGQIKIDERPSERRITLRNGTQRNGECRTSVWESSPRTEQALAQARETFFDPDDVCNQRHEEAVPGWLERFTGSFQDDPVILEIARLGRELREEDRPANDEDS